MFYSSLGHMPETFRTPELVGHFLAGVQYLMLGDPALAGRTTPNPPLGSGLPGLAAELEAARTLTQTRIPTFKTQVTTNTPPSHPASLRRPPAVPSISQRPTGSSLGTIRVGASDNNIWFGWRVGVPTAALKPLIDQRRARQDGSHRAWRTSSCPTRSRSAPRSRSCSIPVCSPASGARWSAVFAS